MNEAREEAQKLVNRLDELIRKFADDTTEALWNFKTKHHIPVDGVSTLEEAQAMTYEDIASDLGFHDLDTLVDIFAGQVMNYAEK